MSYRDTPKAYAPHLAWESISVWAGIAWRDNANRKKLPKVEIAYKNGSRIYTGTCALYGGIDESYKGMYELVPLAQYDGPTYDVSSHDGMSYNQNEQVMPDGSVRNRFDDRGSLVLVDGRQFVLGDQLKVCPLIPETAALVSRSMAEHFVFNGGSSYRRYQKMDAWETTEPVFGDCEDVTFYEYEANGSLHRFGLYLNQQGGVTQMGINSLDNLVELRQIEARLSGCGQGRPKASVGHQLAFF